MTTRYVDETVRRIRRNPDPGESVLVAVGVASGAGNVEGRITALGDGVELRERRRYGTLLVDVDETELDALCSIDGVTAVEAEQEASLHPSGN